MEEDQLRPCDAMVIGGSAGSLDVLLNVLPDLNVNLSFPIVIVVHRKHGADSLLPSLLSGRTKLKVKEAEEKEPLLPGHIYVAPSDYHLLIENDRTFSLDYSEKVNYSRPAIDVTFESAASVYREKLVCMLLSGSNADGVKGLKAVKAFGGTAAIQDPLSALIPYMPAQAAQNVKIDFTLGIKDTIEFINLLSSNKLS
jgi:two-component system chemotaxis response regulator CheB